MFNSDVIGVNEVQTDDIQETLQHHEFVSLPIGEDGTQRVYRIYDFQGVVYCDFLLYRISNERGAVLRNEATLLLQNLSQLDAQIQSHPLPLTPPLYCHAITFLGKKAYVLATASGRLVSTRLLPLLIIDSESLINLNLDLTSISPTHVVSKSDLNQYLADNLGKTNQRKFQVDNPFHQLRKSYYTLGLALILLPLLLGLSGIFWGLSQSPLVILTGLVGILGPVFLTRKASKAFNQFRLQHNISIPPSMPIILLEPDPFEPDLEFHSQVEAQIESLDEVLFSKIPWTPNTTAVFLQDSISLSEKQPIDTLTSTDTTDSGESD